MKEKIINIPNTLTTFRLILSIPLAISILSNYSTSALITLIIAAITELDGTVARISGSATKFGSLCDPIVDGLFITTGLISLILIEKLNIYLLLILGIVNIPRIIFMRLSIKKIGKVKSSILSKISGLSIALIIPIEIIKPEYSDGFIIFNIIFSSSIMLKYLYDYYKKK